MKSEPEQLAMFKRIADGDFRPNENGLFDIAQVAHLVTKRGCRIIDAGDYSCDIHRGLYRPKIGEKRVTASIMAHDKGLWHPVNIFRACRQAAGQPHYEIDYGRARIKNPGGLNEVLIAQVVGADGVRPYLSRPSRYFTDQRITDTTDGDTIETFKGPVGGWTFPMFSLFNPWVNQRGKSCDYRRAVRALDDAGLLKLTVGPRGGFGTATFEWLPAAYLAVEAPKLDHADSEFLTDLMAVSG
jgi:hypothetical protein